MAITVADLAKRVGVPPHVVRHYTRIGLLKPRRNRGNRYRLYAESDVVRLRFIRRAKSLGFTLSDIGQILRDSDRNRSPCPKTREIIEVRLDENDKHLGALVELQTRMKRAIKVWKKMPDKMPTGESICHLIEAVTKNEGIDEALK